MKTAVRLSALALSAMSLDAATVLPVDWTKACKRVIIPTPIKMALSGEEMETDGFEVSGDMPPYAREAGCTLFSGKTPLDFRYDAALGPQAYRLSIRCDGVRMAAGDAPGAIYAVQTLRQLVRKLPDGKFAVALGEVDDKPAFSVRGINWNMFVEVRSWSMDDGRGIEDFKRRFIAGLDTMSFFKLNAVIVDGLGWNPERFPGYGALMRSLAHEARRRGIRLGFAGTARVMVRCGSIPMARNSTTSGMGASIPALALRVRLSGRAAPVFPIRN